LNTLPVKSLLKIVSTLNPTKIKKYYYASFAPVLVSMALIMQSCLLAKIDRTPYKQTAFYDQFRKQIQQVNTDSLYTRTDTIQAGWAKVNITPEEPVAMAGYGNRWGKKYTSVHDSLWVRAFVFDNGYQKAVLLTMDMLIVPPEVREALEERLPQIGFTIDQTYLTATHTHYSYGGWAKKLVGKIIAGRYRDKVVEKLTDRILVAIQQADARKQKASFGFGQYHAGELVYHRINRQGNTDPWLRVFLIRQQSGATAVISSFAAHATLLPSRQYVLSRDYPGALVDTLEKHPDIDFAAFCAGGVGSHSTGGEGEHFEKIGNVAAALSQKIIHNLPAIRTQYQQKLASIHMPLPLRRPQWRISENWRLRPWVFYGLYGDYPSSLTGLRIGDVTWIGTPCDFAGEMMPAIEKQTDQKLIITSFNGGYIGYITADPYYDVDHYETRAMNWFGPENGAYFIEAISQLANKL
jgi:neutral ceramidase